MGLISNNLTSKGQSYSVLKILWGDFEPEKNLGRNNLLTDTCIVHLNLKG